MCNISETRILSLSGLLARHWPLGVVVRAKLSNRMESVSRGLAMIERRAGSFPSCFTGYKPRQFAHATDIPVGQIVFCLPFIDSEAHWRVVILHVVTVEIEYARLAWVHPDSLRPLVSENVQPIVKVGLAEGRGHVLQ